MYLWFLYYLIFFILSVIVLWFCVFRKFVVYEVMLIVGNKLVCFLVGVKSVLIFLVVFIVCCLWWMNYWGIDMLDKFFVFLWLVFCLYFGCFLIGWVFQYNCEWFQVYSCFLFFNGVFVLISIFVLIVFMFYELQFGYECYLWVKVLFCFVYGIIMWMLIFFMFGLCKKLFSSFKVWIGYLFNVFYWLYLIYLLLVVVL